MAQQREYGRGTIVTYKDEEMRVGWRRYDDGFKQEVYTLFYPTDVDERTPVTPVFAADMTLVRLKEN